MSGFRRFCRRTFRCRVYGLGLLGLLLAGTALCSCAPASGSTLPPATVVKSEPTLPQATIEVSLSPTVGQVQTPESQATVPPEQVVTVTILHTNDVMGEIDPCG